MTASPSQNRINSTDYVSIPDANFRAYLKGIIPEAFSGDQLDAEHQSVKGLTKIEVNEKGITSLQGMEYFIALEELYCKSNLLTSLDLSSVPSLTELHCSGNKLTSLDLGSVPSLTELHCGSNQLTSLDLGSVPSLTELSCYCNQLTSLDLGLVDSLTTLACNNNQLTSLDLGSVPSLTELHCGSNQLTSLDLGLVDSLTTLACNNNQLTSLDLGPVSSLTYLDCNANQLMHLDLGSFSSLKKLFLYNNQLSSLDLRGIRSTDTLEIYRDNDPIKSLKTLVVSEAIKDHDAIQNVKSSRGDAVTISTYNDLGQLSCYNYDPTTKTCVTQHAPWYKPFYAKAIFDKEDSPYEIKDEDVIKCYNEDKRTLYLPEDPGTSPASRVLVLPTKGQVTVSVRKDTEQYLLNGEIASKQLTLSTQGRPYGFLWDGTYWQVR